MNRGLIQAAQSMANAELRVSSIAANLANVSTPGFKRQTTALQRFELPHLPNQTPRAVLVPKTDVAFSQGSLAQTGREMDLALRGEGFFVVDDQSQGTLLTRNGVFMLREDGNIVNDYGQPLAWKRRSGLLDQLLPVEVNTLGEVRQEGELKGLLDIRAYANPQDLQMNAAGDWIARDDAPELPPDVEVLQGFLEKSNASAVDQLVGMISAQRSYERNAQVIQSIAENYQRLSRPS